MGKMEIAAFPLPPPSSVVAATAADPKEEGRKFDQVLPLRLSIFLCGSSDVPGPWDLDFSGGDNNCAILRRRIHEAEGFS